MGECTIRGRVVGGTALILEARLRRVRRCDRLPHLR